MNRPASPILIGGGDFYEALVESNPETGPSRRSDRPHRLGRRLYDDCRRHERPCRPELGYALVERHRGRAVDVHQLPGNKKVIDAFVDHCLYV